MTKEEIKNIRKTLGLTQQLMAERVGVDIKKIRNYEKTGNIPKSKEAILLNLYKECSFKNSNISPTIKGDNNPIIIGEHNTNGSNLTDVITELKNVIQDKDKTITDKDKIIADKDKTIDTLREELKEKTNQINTLLNIVQSMNKK